ETTSRQCRGARGRTLARSFCFFIRLEKDDLEYSWACQPRRKRPPNPPPNRLPPSPPAPNRLPPPPKRPILAGPPVANRWLRLFWRSAAPTRNRLPITLPLLRLPTIPLLVIRRRPGEDAVRCRSRCRCCGCR